MKFPKELIILPAHLSHAISFDHGMVSERLGNLRHKLELLNLSRPSFIEASLKRIPPVPANYLTIAALNKSGSYDGYQPADLEAGANRCAVS